MESSKLGGKRPKKEGHLSVTHQPIPAEFRREAVRLVESSGKSRRANAREIGISTETLRLWVKQTDIDEGMRHDGLTTTETEEIRRLRRESKALREEREILLKAAAFFAKVTDSRL